MSDIYAVASASATARIRALESEKAALEARVKELEHGAECHVHGLDCHYHDPEDCPECQRARAEKAEADLAAQKNATQAWADVWEDIEAVQTRLTELALAALRDFIYKECDGNPENVAWILKRAAGRESGGDARTPEQPPTGQPRIAVGNAAAKSAARPRRPPAETTECGT